MGEVIAETTNHESDAIGHWGKWGGQFVPEALMAVIGEVTDGYAKARVDQDFLDELDRLQRTYVGRPSPLYYAEKFSADIGADVWLKREDLNHTGSHKINNVLGQVLLAKRMGKKNIIAETGAGQHGVATATACALLGLNCRIYMGKVDAIRQRLNIARMRLLGAEVIEVEIGSKTLKDAINEAMRFWVSHADDTYYCFGTAAGPHPFPTMVRDFQRIISAEARQQILAETGSLPDAVVACVGGGSNAIGMFADFIEEEEVELVGAEPGGEGLDSGKHGATINNGTVGILHGARSYLMRNADGQVEESYSISAGLDYPGVGPQHAHLHASGRAQYVGITDAEALEAFQLLSTKEGIIPALESSHALAYALKRKDEDITILVSLSGRGDKDIDHVRHTLENHPEFKLQEKN